jgi:hypothetical protein
MTPFWQVPAVVLTMLISFVTGPGSLNTLSRREALRRQLTPPAKATLSNATLPEGAASAAVSDESAPPATTSATPPDETGVAAAAGAAGGQKAGEPAHDEKWWRDRMAKARKDLAKDEAAVGPAESRANSLTTAAVNTDDPAKQLQVRQQLLTTLAEVERLKTQIEVDKKAIADIQSEARRAGIPPGWIR